MSRGALPHDEPPNFMTRYLDNGGTAGDAMADQLGPSSLITLGPPVGKLATLYVITSSVNTSSDQT